MKSIRLILIAAAATCAASFTATAGEPVKADFGTDLVSTYIWRGQKLDGAAIQPALGLEWGGLSFSAWGSTGITMDNRELDFTLAYTLGGLTVGLTDYWCADSGTKYFYFKDDTPHVVEFNVGYDFGPVALNWYTNAVGAVGCNDNGDKAYASYIEVSAPFSFGGLDWTAAAGASPWANDYYDASGFSVVCLSLTAEKTLSIGSAELPVFAQVMANPRSEKMFFAVGVSF